MAKYIWYCEYCDGYCELVYTIELKPTICPYGLEDCKWKMRLEEK